MTRVKLGEIAHEYKGKAKESEIGVLPIVGLEHLSSGDIDLAGFNEGDESTFTKKFLPGHVLFGRRRAYQRKASLAEFPGICSGDITVIEADESVLEPRLLPFIIQNDRLFDFAVENSAGSLSPRVKWARLAEYELDLPTLEEQRGLADVLWAAQEVRRKYKQLMRASNDIVKSRFVEMFGDVEDTLEIQELIIPKTKITYGIVQPGPEGTGDMGVLRPVDIVDGCLSLKNVKRIDCSIGDSYKRTELTGDEILTVVRGATGQTVRSTPDAAKMNVTRGIAVIRYDATLVDPDYLVACMNSDDGQRYIAEHTQGATLQQINISDLKIMPIPMPPLALQQEFAAFVQQVDKSKVALQQSLDDLNATMAAILNEELGGGNV